MVQTRRQRKPPVAASASCDEADDVIGDNDADETDDEPENTPKNKRKRRQNNGRTGKARSGSAGQRRAMKSASSSAAEKLPATKDSIESMNDDITKVKTAKNCAKQWNDLFTMRDNRRSIIIGSCSTTDSNDNNTRDVFDCSDLIVPPAHELVNREVERGIERWKDLASRIIMDEDGPIAATAGKTEEGGKDSEEGEVPLQNHELLSDATIGGDKRKQRLLPFNFDYACKRKPSDTHSDEEKDDGGRRPRARVISLLDPTQNLDYEEELWRVFKSVKTADELESLHALGSSAAAEGTTIGAAAHGCQHTLSVKNNLKEWLSKYSRMDAHSLGRLRIRERHPNPGNGSAFPCQSSFSNATNATGLQGSIHSKMVDDSMGQSSDILHTTIRFEILRHSQNLERGSGRDSNRMEVELHGSQHTLLDLHRLLVECSLNTDSHNHIQGGVGSSNIRPGVFFIEDTFYTCGEVGDRVGETIMRWLDGKEHGLTEDVDETEEGSMPLDESTVTPRRQFLGLSSSENITPMSQVKLEDIPLRLGVRYFHMFVPPSTPLQLRPHNMWSLANESAVYVTGIHTHNKTSMGNVRNEPHQSTDSKAPIIIHDSWGPPQRQRHTCLACNYSLASVVTVNDPLTDAAPASLDSENNKVHLQGVPMCSSCYQALHYQRSDQLEEGENGNQPLLELRPDHKPSLVFRVEDYQRMVTTSSIDEIPKNAPF